MGNTKIEWAEKSWNPITGCTKVSEGCRNCYAERLTKRFWPEINFNEVKLHPDRLGQPLHWKKPSRIFVCSMSDLFHEDIDDGFLCRVFDTMLAAENHTFLLLTKRPERMRGFVKRCAHGKIKNIWYGVTAENQRMADERIPILLQIPAAVRFISIEPMLGPVDLLKSCDVVIGDNYDIPAVEGIGKYLDWVICGTESGPNRRPAKTEWIRELKNQCANAGMPFFLKQMDINGRLVKMPELDGQVWDECPEV